MLKKITALICAIIIAVIPAGGAVMASGAEYTVAMKKAELAALGIEIPELLPKVSMDTYIYAIAGLLYEEPKKLGSAEEIAVMTGMLEPGEVYDGNAAVVVSDAVKYAVIALGYGQAAEIEGGYPNGYLKVASDIKLTKNLGADRSAALGVEDAVELLYAMLEIEPMISYADNTGNTYFKTEKNETLLSINRDIYKIEGLMTKSEFTSIYGEDGAKEGYIAIGEERYAANGIEVDDLLGKNVVAYVRENGVQDYEIVYVGEDVRQNDELIIAAEDIQEAAEDFSYIKYVNENDRVKNAKLTAALKVIYNGEYYADYTVSDLYPQIGRVRLVDNDTDGKYDIVFVESYETMVVSSVVDSEIYSRYDFDGAIKMLDTDQDGDVVKCSIYKGGKKAALGDIKANDVLSVGVSKNADGQIITIHISQEKITGTVGSVDRDEMEIEVDGEVYRMAQDFIDFVDAKAYDLSLGKENEFYLDGFGNVVFAKSTGDSEYSLIYKVTTEDDEYFVTYMDMDGEWYTAKIAQKLRLDDNTYFSEDVYEALKEESMQLVKIKKSSAGEIKKIETPEETSQSRENGFTKTAQSSMMYRSGPKTFANAIYLNSDAKVIVLPQDSSNKESIEVKAAASYFIGDKKYPVCAYDIDEFGFTGLVSVVENDDVITARRKNSFVVVTKVMQALNADDEIVPSIVGSMGNLQVRFTGTSEDTFEDVMPGDIINVSVNNKGEVDLVTPVFSLSESFVSNGASDYYLTRVIISGFVEKVDDTATKIRLNCGGNDISFRVTSSTTVSAYDPVTKSCRALSVPQLKGGDKVVCRVSWGQLSEMVVLREE